jgi:hypothetical protein
MMLGALRSGVEHSQREWKGGTVIKSQELTDPHSCMSRALPDEMTFVLLGRDITAPATIREWCRLRCLHGKNRPQDPQIREALACADAMEAQHGLRKAGA